MSLNNKPTQPKDGGIVTRSLVHLLDFIGLEGDWGTRVRAYICSNLASHIPLKTQHSLLQKHIEDRKVDEDHEYLLFLRDSIKLVMNMIQLMVNNDKAVRYDDKLLAIHLTALNYHCMYNPVMVEGDVIVTTEMDDKHKEEVMKAILNDSPINDNPIQDVREEAI